MAVWRQSTWDEAVRRLANEPLETFPNVRMWAQRWQRFDHAIGGRTPHPPWLAFVGLYSEDAPAGAKPVVVFPLTPSYTFEEVSSARFEVDVYGWPEVGGAAIIVTTDGTRLTPVGPGTTQLRSLRLGEEES